MFQFFLEMWYPCTLVASNFGTRLKDAAWWNGSYIIGISCKEKKGTLLLCNVAICHWHLNGTLKWKCHPCGAAVVAKKREIDFHILHKKLHEHLHMTKSCQVNPVSLELITNLQFLPSSTWQVLLARHMQFLTYCFETSDKGCSFLYLSPWKEEYHFL